MSRLLLFGLSPLPFENTLKNFGPGIRAWQFIEPLLKQDHDILFIANRIPFIYPKNIASEVQEKQNGFQYIHMSDAIYRNNQRIQELHDAFNPDAILAATIFSITPLAELKTDAPVWIDLFGHVPSEAQAKAYRYSDDSYLAHYLKHEIQALTLGDVFSSVSKRQEAAVIGELGLIGRLDRSTTGYDFCHTIPCAMDPAILKHKKNVFRGIDVPESAFVILWSGGFNTWTDIETLVDGLEIAMKHNPDIWFVSTGGQIDGHDEKTYPAFLNRIQNSSCQNRFINRGWIPKNEVANYYFEANLGVSIDRFMYEGYFGSKNRILDWMRAGLPTLTSNLCELSQELPNNEIGFNFPLNDSEALSRKILYLASHPEMVKETGIRAQSYGIKTLNFNNTTQPFQKWLKHSQKSPDHIGKDRTNLQLFFDSTKSFQSRQYEDQLRASKKQIRKLEKYIHYIEKEFANLENEKLNSIRKTKKPILCQPKPLIFDSEQPRVSIIIVTWNGVKYLKKCLHSVLNQNYPDFECIVVDNASVDGSVELIEEQFPSIKLIKNTRNIGFSKAINIGLEAISGDVVILLNQDTEALPGWVDAMVKGLASDPYVAIGGCKIFNPDKKTIQHAGGILHENCLTDHLGAGELDSGKYDRDHDCDYVTGAALGFKRELLNHIGYFDPRFSPAYFEELDFCIRASRHQYNVRYFHKAKIVHYESQSTGKFSRRFFNLYHRNRLKFLFKHYRLRYILGTFRKSESQWISKHIPREQILPLIFAYFYISPRLIHALVRDLIWRR